MSSLSAVLALTFALASGAASAQEPATQTPARPSAQLEDVVVEGRQLEALVADFVSEIAQPANNRGLARWNRAVCVGAVNLRGDVARYVIDRVSDVARELGVHASEPGCRPNILIVGTVDGATLASTVAAARPQTFDLRHNSTDAGTAAFRAFLTADRPVRWWQTSLPVDSETGGRAVRLPGDIDPATGRPSAPGINITGGASRLRTQIRDSMVRSIVIIDFDRLGGADLVQLADYVTFVALAQIDHEADIAGFRTILNLFDDPATAPEGLTDWDTAYLGALYEHDQLRINRHSQTRSVVDSVVRERRAASEATPE